MGSVLAPKPKPAPVIVAAEPVAAPVEAPKADNSAEEIRKAQNAELERLRKQRGRAATQVSTAETVNTGGLATKMLLGG